MEKTKTRKVYLPKGIWFDYWTKKKVKSQGGWTETDVTIETIPIFIKNGSILVYKKENSVNTEESIYPVDKIESYGKDAAYIVTDGNTEMEIRVSKGGLLSPKNSNITFLHFN